MVSLWSVYRFVSLSLFLLKRDKSNYLLLFDLRMDLGLMGSSIATLSRSPEPGAEDSA